MDVEFCKPSVMKRLIFVAMKSLFSGHAVTVSNLHTWLRNDYIISNGLVNSCVYWRIICSIWLLYTGSTYTLPSSAQHAINVCSETVQYTGLPQLSVLQSWGMSSRYHLLMRRLKIFQTLCFWMSLACLPGERPEVCQYIKSSTKRRFVTPRSQIILMSV